MFALRRLYCVSAGCATCGRVRAEERHRSARAEGNGGGSDGRGVRRGFLPMQADEAARGAARTRRVANSAWNMSTAARKKGRWARSLNT